MKILFLCTAHNSLSQRLYLALSPSHDVTVEYALSDGLIISAAELAKPDLIICPFLTARVPKEVYNKYLTLIIHPGPPGDAGPSALDWLLLGDDGSVKDNSNLLQSLDRECRPGRSHWGITILQAIDQFDAGPVWAWEQFPVDIDQDGLTKSELYRGPVSRSAISACLTALRRIQLAAGNNPISPALKVNPDYKTLSVRDQIPFQGGTTHDRPLLKAAQREFDVNRHTAQHISRRIRCGDSQPGSLSRVFGQSLYVYGGIIEACPEGPNPGAYPAANPGTIVAVREEAVCISTCDGRGIWITHVRRPKRSADPALWPKVPAVSGLVELGILSRSELPRLHWELPNDFCKSPYSTFQEVWVDFVSYGPENTRAAYLYFDFYNGAMSTSQCSHLISAMNYILACSSPQAPIRALVMMGGAYFSNGVALNVIESASDPAVESWRNINRIDDVVQSLLHSFRSANIMTIAAVRGNAAAGGVALAAACDVVIAGAEVVLNPAYRGIGLFGSEYHTLSYYGRCGQSKATEILRAMTPISPFDARAIGLVDHVFPGTGVVLDKRVRNHVAVIVRSGHLGRVRDWKGGVDLSSANLAIVRATELGEMAQDFWSARAARYNVRRFGFVRKVKATHTPLRFAKHRRVDETYLDEEERDSYDDVGHYERVREETRMAELQTRLETTAVDSRVDSRGRSPMLRVPIGVNAASRSSETLFSCYYSSPELVAVPSNGLSSPSSVTGGEHR
jgi:enoyl-CoA hydratase/carnithine racemase/methionyl-tRNA formyltransferase